MDRITPNFIYAFILRRLKLGLVPAICRKFLIELWPLIDERISFLFNIFTTNGQFLTIVCIWIDIDKI